jgi:hypothetical protein
VREVRHSLHQRELSKSQNSALPKEKPEKSSQECERIQRMMRPAKSRVIVKTRKVNAGFECDTASFSQELKHDREITRTDEGMQIDRSALHSENADSPRCAILPPNSNGSTER